MKMTPKFLTLLFIATAFVSCRDDDNGSVPLAVESKTASNIPAPQTGGQGQPVGGPFTKFSFETGAVTTSDTDWDIAFRGTTIAINGGAVTGTDDEPTRNGNAGAFVASGTFASITDASGLTFAQDADGAFTIAPVSDQGWYNYSGPPANIISPIPGSILIIRTHDSKYAKVEILSYYKDAPAQPDASSEFRFYTFNYVYNPNDGETSLQ